MSILFCIASACIYPFVDSAIKTEVKSKDPVNRPRLAYHAWNLSVLCLALCHAIFSNHGLLDKNKPSDKKLPPCWISFCQLVVTHDFLAKLMTMGLKTVVVALSAGRARGNRLRLMERTSQVYRFLVPVLLTFGHCLYSVGKMRFVMDFLSRIVFYEQNGRFASISQACKRWLEAWKCFRNDDDMIGTAPSQDEIDEAKDFCPICYDSFNNPLKLSCSHIFCEGCISTWLDRETNCPMCRVKMPKLTWCDGSTLQDIIYT